MFRFLLFFVFLLPLSPTLSHWAALAAFLVWLFIPNKNWRGLLQPAVLLPFAWFLWHTASSLLLHNTGQPNANDITINLGFVLFPLLFGTTDVTTMDTKYYLKYLYTGTLLAMLYCIAIAIKNYFSSDINVFFYENLVAPLNFHPTYFGWCVGFLLLFALYDFIFVEYEEKTEGSNDNLHRLQFFSVFFFSIALILLSSRIALLSVFIILVAWFLYKMYEQGKIWLGLGITVGSAAVMLFIISQINFLKWRFGAIFPFLLNADEQTRLHTDPRSLIFEKAAQVIYENPIFGIGKQASAQLVENTTKLTGTILNNTHNQFFQTQLVLGIVGTSILVGMLIVLLKKAYLLKNHGIFPFIIFVFVGLFVGCSMTEALLERERGILFFAFFFALFSNLKIRTAISDTD